MPMNSIPLYHYFIPLPIEWAVFSGYKSLTLSSLKLKKVKVVETAAFHQCEAMTEAKFDKRILRFGTVVFRVINE